MQVYKLFPPFLLAISFILSGCSATGARFSKLEPVDSSAATVYIYRPWMMLDGAAAPTVQIDSVDMFNIKNGGFEVLNLDSGNHELTIKKGSLLSNWRADKMSLSYDFKSGQRYFFRLFSDTSKSNYVFGVMTIANDAYSFGLVSEEFAIKELQELKQN